MHDSAPAVPPPADPTGPAAVEREEAVTVTYHHIRTGEVQELTGTFTCWQRLRSGPTRGEPGAALRLADGEIRIVPVTLLTTESGRLLGEPDIPMMPERRRRRGPEELPL